MNGPSDLEAAIAYAAKVEASLEQISREQDSWDRVARPKQVRPPRTRLWILHTGRGWGKSRTAAEDVRRAIENGAKELLCIGPTSTDVHDVQVPMLLRVLEAVYPGEVEYKRSIDAPCVLVRGATVHLRSGQRIDRCRGLGVEYVWADEVDSWKPEGIKPWEAWVSVVEPTCRLGVAQFTITSTPKRGGLISILRKRSDAVVVTGHTRENAENLTEGFVASLSEAFSGSWLERQELGGEVVEEVFGALVTREMLELGRVGHAPELTRIVVGVDPSGGEAEQGIVVAGKTREGDVYILADRTCLLPPDGWGRRVITAYEDFACNLIVAERNYGGAMVESTLRTVYRQAPIKLVTATRGKHVRFEPVAACYAQGRVHHVGTHTELENELTAFTANGYEAVGSPNRADALVWAVLELVGGVGITFNELYGDGGYYDRSATA